MGFVALLCIRIEALAPRPGRGAASSPSKLSDPLKILHCIPTFRSGGAERQLSILAPAQVARGSKVDVAYVHPGPHLSALADGGVNLHQIRAAGNYDPRIFLRLWSLVARERPDVIQTWLPQMDILGGTIALARGVPWIMAERSSGDAYTARFVDRVVRRWIGQWADAVAANSEAGQAIWSRILHKGARAHLVRNALSLDRIARSSAARPEDLGTKPGTPLIVSVGRLSYEKNIPFLLSVARDICARTNAVFFICGDGPLREQAEEALRTSGLRDRIRLLGEQDTVWPLMKAAQAFVSTSFFEGQPNAVLEAMACECPLVLSDIPAHREFLGDESAAIVPMIREEFVRAILRVLQRTSDILARVERARLQAARYDAASAALAYEMVYKDAVRRHNRCVA